MCVESESGVCEERKGVRSERKGREWGVREREGSERRGCK